MSKFTKIEYWVTTRYNSKEDIIHFVAKSYTELLKWLNNADMLLVISGKITIELKHIEYENTHKS